MNMELESDIYWDSSRVPRCKCNHLDLFHKASGECNICDCKQFVDEVAP